MPSTRVAEERHRVVEGEVLDPAGPYVLEDASAEYETSSLRWSTRFVRWFDELISIPGTDIKLGLDVLIGFILPGFGDTVTGVGSMALLLTAIRERVPTIILLRMVLNIVVDVVGGLLPFVGDAFDVYWRSNRRNLDLIEAYRGESDRQPSVVDYALVGGGFILALASIALPILILYGLGISIFDALGQTR